MEKNTIRMIAFGDSLTYGYGVSESVAYPHRLALDLTNQYPHLSFEVINSGINGHTTREALSRLSSSVLCRKPQIVLIWFGSNDSALNEGQYRTPYEYEKNLRQILTEIFALSTEHSFANGKTVAILLTPPPMVEDDFFPFTTNDRLEKYRDIVKALSQEYQLYCIDLFAIYQSITDPTAYASCFQSDGLHLSNHGYDIAYAHILKTIQQVMKDSAILL